MTDSFGRQITYMRLSVTDLCNQRCRYCMPEDGICRKSHDDILTEDEMINAVKIAASLGVTKLRITGGEPLVKKNILSICERSAAVEGIKEVCLTTNGVLLPQMAQQLRDAGVNRLNISLDTLDREKFLYITRRDNCETVLHAINKAVEAGFDKIKVNAVLIGGFNDDEIPQLAALTKTYPIDVRFIEYMPMPYADADFSKKTFIPCSAVTDALPELIPVDKHDGVARLFRFPDGKGNVGLISPLSNHFCSECNRIRLTADGRLLPCLHSSLEFPIKGLDYDAAYEKFKEAIMAKPRRHAPMSDEQRSESKRNMNQIGG